MQKKIRISAGDLPTLRDFLVDADVDLGCRPHARRTPAGVQTEAIADDDQLSRLNARRAARAAAGVEIEVIAELPPPAARLRLARGGGNRFAGGAVPRGLGRKE